MIKNVRYIFVEFKIKFCDLRFLQIFSLIIEKICRKICAFKIYPLKKTRKRLVFPRSPHVFKKSKQALEFKYQSFVFSYYIGENDLDLLLLILAKNKFLCQSLSVSIYV